jgi:hypothetical protein
MSTSLHVESASTLTIVSLVLGLILVGMPAVSAKHFSARVYPKKPAADKSANRIQMTIEQLRRYYPDELRRTKFSSNQDELGSLLQKVGERVEGLFLNYPNTTSKEDVLLERLKANGKTEESLRRSFYYMVRVSHDQAWLGFQEDRSDNRTPEVKKSNG